MSEPDRVNYTLGCKVNMGNYESVNLNISYSTDSRSNETIQETLERAITFVEHNIDKKREELTGEKNFR